jgi:alpha-tubulin suppressor-like RCC1 family protein
MLFSHPLAAAALAAVLLLPSAPVSSSSSHDHGHRESVRATAIHIGAPDRVTHLSGVVRWPRGGTVRLDGPVVVDSGVVLRIEAGTRVEARLGAYLVVPRDGRIEATGTINEPIEMTCTDAAKYPGCWGGVIVHGYARINSGTLTSPATPRGTTGGCLDDLDPVINARFGGCNDADSSGVLAYVRIEYAERGLQLSGVGSGTVVHDVQANRTRNEGVLVNGGTAPLRDLFLTANGIGLRWTGGWRGDAQFIAIQQDYLRFAAGIVGQNGTTASIAASDATPRSAPRLFNLTVIAQSDPANASHATARAVVLERGTAATIRNLFLYAPQIALDIAGSATCAQFNAAALTLRNVVTAGAVSLGDGANGAGCSSAEGAILSSATDNNITLAGAAGQLVSENDLFLPDLRPVNGSALALAPAAAPPTGSIFASAPYVGGIPATGPGGKIPWFSGWTVPAPPPAPIPNGTLIGTVSSPFRGILGGTVVTDATTGATTTADASGNYTLTLPAGTALLDVSAVPSACPAPRTRSGIVQPNTTTRLDLTVDCPPLPGTERIAGGDGFACAIADQGTFCWGENALGELGNGTTAPNLLPGIVTPNFTSISAGAQHACGVQPNGIVLCWGDGSQGQIGDGAGVSRSTPTPGIAGAYVMVTSGGAHSCALAADGRAFCWGANASGQLGNGSTSRSLTPVEVTGGPAFATIAAGRNHTCALDLTGAAWCWGANADGQLGDGSNADRARPVAVSGGEKYKELAGGGDAHTCASGANGIVRCWGANDAGQLGNSASGSSSNVPVTFAAALPLSQLTLGDHHSCGISTESVSWCWGANSEGQIGDGTTTPRAAPTAAAASARFSRITGGTGFTCAVTFGAVTSEGNVIVVSRRSLLCWGRNSSGQYGRGDTTPSLTPAAAATGLTVP